MKKISLKDIELYDENVYETWVKFKGIGEEVELLIDMGTDDEDKFPAMLEFANKFLEWVVENDLEIKKYAAGKLLKNKNKNWLEPKEKPLTEKDFIGRLVISSLSINSNKSSNIFYDADEMFTDHAVIVEASKNFKLN
jgi:hypothetical protein